MAPSVPSPSCMALLYGPGPDLLCALSVLYGPPVWSWARPPLCPLRLVWPSCMVLGPTSSVPSPSCMALLYGPGPDPPVSLEQSRTFHQLGSGFPKHGNWIPGQFFLLD